jgi:predicted SpoU family rRNA methylase
MRGWHVTREYEVKDERYMTTWQTSYGVTLGFTFYGKYISDVQREVGGVEVLLCVLYEYH